MSCLRWALIGSLVLPHCSTLSLSRAPLIISQSFRGAGNIRQSSFCGTTTSLSMLSSRGGGGGRRGSGGGRSGSSRSGRPRRPREAPPPMPLPGEPGRGCFRDLVVVGKDVFVVKKNDQRSGVETRGTVRRHLTNSPYHPRGIKVMLTSGEVGRVTRFIDDE